MHNEGMIYGYARVSTDAQDLTNQVAQLKAAGCATIFREKMTGTHAERPQLKKLMAKLGGVSPNPRKFRQVKLSSATIASRSIICPLSRKV